MASGAIETVVSTELIKSVITIRPSCTAQLNVAEIATSVVNVCVNPQSSLQETIASSQNKPTAILGALLGLFVLLITVTTVGWVWTLYQNYKLRSKKVKNSASTGEEINTDDIERDYKNPIYGEYSSSTTLLQGKALPSQDNTQTQIEGGDVHIYDILNRGQTTGANKARDQSGPHDVDGGSYSKLGIHDKDIDNNYCLLN